MSTAATAEPGFGAATRRPAVSVIVCAWDDGRWDDLCAAVRSVREQTAAAHETIVVIDHNAALAERARRELPAAVVLENASERGLAGARNTGVDHARGEVIAFLDDDAVADPRWLERLCDHYADPGIVGVGGWVEPAWPGERPAWLPPEFDWVVGCSYRGLPENGHAIRNPIGANMSFRREAFERAGSFRTGMGRVGRRPVGCEETEFSIRTLQSAPGSRVALDRGAVVRHRVAPERTSFRYFASRCWSEGVSKALVARHVGSGDGLSSERTYVRRDLPRAIAAGLRAALKERDVTGLARAGAVVSGVTLAAAGYAFGSMRGARADAEDEGVERTWPATRRHTLDDVTVVVPVRNAEHWIGDCLESLAASGPREIIVVDGLSSDATVSIAERYADRILSDGGEGLPAARRIGAEAARTELVALVDADVVFPEGRLEQLLREYDEGGYHALQAGLESTSPGGYWGEALAFHHRTGRSRHWFGLVATIFDRATLLEQGFDERFSSGEDIDLRWRLREAGCRIGVSEATMVEHRFGDDFEFAKGQWLADGAGLGRMVSSRGLRATPLLGLPLAAGLRGIGLCVIRLRPRWIPYFLCFVAYNYATLLGVLARSARRRLRSAPA